MNLLDVAGQGDTVEAEVVRGRLLLAAELDLQGAALDGAANDLLELRLEQVIRIGGADRYLEVAIVESAKLDGQGKLLALEASLPIAGHTQEHANLASDR